ncbi:SDR family NAD(P)-dependent oxidoreductase [Brachybacterium vulturis]|uniref:SDR family NAD(P)-dependent oxidoreductase n=1 Tax=Brachybacterium vulturis TaxID=2017484 RepID=UPI003736E3B4
MSGKNGIVTGAGGGGIGRASALAFANAGARVLIMDIAAEPLEETARLIGEAGGTAETMVGDASDEDFAAQMVARTVELWETLDFAHNNAGIGIAATPFAQQERSTWDRVFTLNAFGAMSFMKHELRQMEKQGFGAIVNTSSMSGKNGSPGLSPYDASKWTAARGSSVSSETAGRSRLRAAGVVRWLHDGSFCTHRLSLRRVGRYRRCAHRS